MTDEQKNPSAIGKLLKFLILTPIWLLLLPWLAWSFGALWFDLPLPGWSEAIAIFFGVLCLALFVGFRAGWISVITTASLAALITIGWNQQEPMQHRNWKPEVAVLPSIEEDGDTFTIHNLRNFDYRTEDDFEVRHETRVVHLANLRGADLFLNYWGSELMAHPIISFDFGEEGRVCFSVETRPEVGEDYSALRGLYHGFELICLAADERDIIRLRTNYRQGEDVYLYRLTEITGREAFLEYVNLVNRLHQKPEWYNAITQNCTTSLRSHRNKNDRSMWDWRMLVNGYLDTLLYERGKITNSLPFEELKKRSLINQAAEAADQDPAFSLRIREGLPGFDEGTK